MKKSFNETKKNKSKLQLEEKIIIAVVSAASIIWLFIWLRFL